MTNNNKIQNSGYVINVRKLEPAKFDNFKKVCVVYLFYYFPNHQAHFLVYYFTTQTSIKIYSMGSKTRFDAFL